MRWVLILKAMILGLVLIAPASASEGLVFDTSLSASSNFSFFPFWRQVLTDMAAAQPQVTPIATHTDVEASCTNTRLCIPGVWITFLDTVRGAPPLAQLSAVNHWANTRPYVEDVTNWGVPDYWETPGEFLTRGGDCEDFAITKYLSLVRLGFSPDDLRIVIVKDVSQHVFHAVLAARVHGVVWLLDNQIQQMIPMASASQYVPIYSLNEHGWWLHSLPKIDLGNVTIAAGAAN